MSFTSRPPWQAAPAALRRAVEVCAGDVVVSVEDVPGGMSPGPAAVLSLRGGARVFAKAVSRMVNAGSYRLYQQEADVLGVMPAEAPAARLVGVAEVDDWIALVVELVPGRVAGPPWTTESVQAAAVACAAVAEVTAPAGVPAVGQSLPDLDGWAKVAAGPGSLSAWESRHIEDLIRATAGWRHWTGGRQLSHQDVRCDNVMIHAVSGRAVLVDWGFGSMGAPWLDRALLATDVMAAGHLDGPEVARRQALALLGDQPVEASRFVIAQAGMWRRSSTLPAHPGMPTHRAWQRERATALQPLLEDLLARTRAQG